MTQKDKIMMPTKGEDKFDLSDGNIEVLSRIPKMMTIDEWRSKIRMVVLDYIIENGLLEYKK